jgi:aspartokinase/homoserine dehydrogenase 1
MTSRDPSAWVVHKFGGSSVADADCFVRVADIIESQPSQRLAVVLSACKGVTDGLLNLVSAAERQDSTWRRQLAALRERHATIAGELLAAADVAEYLGEFDLDATDLATVLQTVSVMRTASREMRDKVSGYGEIWSTRLFRRLLARRGRRAGLQWVDARDAVTVEWGSLGPDVLWAESRARNCCRPLRARS